MAKNPENPRKANIFDVARLAGVSHQTVSRVLNDLPNVRPATRKRVEDAIRQLHYTPSPAARALVTKRSRTIGLVQASAGEYGPSQTALAFSEAARDAQYVVLTIEMATGEGGAVRNAVETLVRQNVEGVVLICDNRYVLDAIYESEIGIPIVSIDAGAPAHSLSASIDQVGGARQAVRHLIELGHRDILHLAGPMHSPDAQARIEGWRAELAEDGLVARPHGVGDWTASSGYQFGRTFPVAEPFTAAFVANDQMAIGFISALTERGYRVPGDVSVVGFDDIPEAQYVHPGLTTVRQDFSALGQSALSLVLEVVDGGEDVRSAGPLPTALQVRGSTAERGAQAANAAAIAVEAG
ncbi:LacI family DNA-binding transcriptional regulator [Leifsonia xyli]|uniref:LacI family DNA-binding transcriptional regulator n=1 Tax=Leifsonia xyli TaxID=1575 RepID=UPI003D66527E